MDEPLSKLRAQTYESLTVGSLRIPPIQYVPIAPNANEPLLTRNALSLW